MSRARHSPKKVVTQPAAPTTVTNSYVDNFDNKAKWQFYDSKGQDGKGLRKPSQIEFYNRTATIYGESDGLTGGMQLLGHPIFRGSVSIDVLAYPGTSAYHPVVLLWGQGSGDSVDAVTGEIDFVEFWNSPKRNVSDFSLHYGNGSQFIGTSTPVPANGTSTPVPANWNNFKLLWTPTKISGLINGVEYYSTTDTSKFPKVPMDVCVQLDWFPDEGPHTASAMGVRNLVIQPLIQLS